MHAARQKNPWRFLWSRIVLLVAIALVPAAAIILHTFLDLRKSSYATIQERLVGLTSFAAAEQGYLLEGTRPFLTALSNIPAIRALHGEACAAILSSILRENPPYVNIGVTDGEGNGICSAFPLPGSVTRRDQVWFQRAMTKKEFSLGDYRIDRITGKPSVDVAYPMLDRNDRVYGVVVATLGLEWLNNLIAQEDGQLRTTTLTILDHTHTIISRHPDPDRWVGLNEGHHPLSLLMQQRRRGSAWMEDIDGTVRFHAFTALPGHIGLPGAYVRMSVTETAILSEVYSNLYKNVALLFIGALLTVLMAWFSGRILIGRFIDEHKRVDALQSEFIGLASHQLRTPLTSIRWIIELFLCGKIGPLTVEQRNLVADAQTCADHMTATIHMLLLISQIEARTFSTKDTAVPVLSLLRELCDAHSHASAEKHLTVTVKCPGDLVIMTDRDMFREILANLLSNAIQYSPRGGTISLHAERASKNRLHLTVADTGYGIPLSQQGRVFTKFFRGANVVRKQTEGSGLGLHLVSVLVGVLSGTITFSSEENRGTTFSVFLPLFPPLHGEAPPHR